MWSSLGTVFTHFPVEIWWSSQCCTEIAASITTPIQFSLWNLPLCREESVSAPSVPKASASGMSSKRYGCVWNCQWIFPPIINHPAIWVPTYYRKPPNGHLVPTNHGILQRPLFWHARRRASKDSQRQSQHVSQSFSQDAPAPAPVKESLGSTFSLRRSAVKFWPDVADSTRLSPEELAKLSKDTGRLTMWQWDWQVIVAVNHLQLIYMKLYLCNHAGICGPISSNPWLRSCEFTARWAAGGAKGLPWSASFCPASACGQEAADQGGDSMGQHGTAVKQEVVAAPRMVHGFIWVSWDPLSISAFHHVSWCFKMFHGFFYRSTVPPSCLLPQPKNAVSVFARLKEGKNKRHSERLVGRRGTQCGTWDSNGWYMII